MVVEMKPNGLSAVSQFHVCSRTQSRILPFSRSFHSASASAKQEQAVQADCKMASRRCLIAAGLASLLAIIIVAIAVPLSLNRNNSEERSTSSSSSASSSSTLESEADEFPSSNAAANDGPGKVEQNGAAPSTANNPSLSPTHIPTFVPTDLPTPSPTTETPTASPTETKVEEAESNCEEYSDTFNLCIDNDVPYYHCNQNQGEVGTDILLLHGASFTKENWRRKGIIDNMCEQVTVVASDLSVSADSNVLIAMLDRLERAGMIRLPLTVVTPSASGRTLVSWLQGASPMEDMTKYVSIWVPVAPYSVLSATDSQLKLLLEYNIGVLAINGDGDRSGRQVSERLVDVADADSVELEGGHAVYLSSPEDFVETVLGFIGVGSERMF